MTPARAVELASYLPLLVLAASAAGGNGLALVGVGVWWLLFGTGRGR